MKLGTTPNRWKNGRDSAGCVRHSVDRDPGASVASESEGSAIIGACRGRASGRSKNGRVGVVSHRGLSSAGFLLLAVVAAGRLNVPAAPLGEARSESRVVTLTLHATVNAEGRDSFSYEGKNIPPVI